MVAGYGTVVLLRGADATRSATENLAVWCNAVNSGQWFPAALVAFSRPSVYTGLGSIGLVRRRLLSRVGQIPAFSALLGISLVLLGACGSSPPPLPKPVLA